MATQSFDPANVHPKFVEAMEALQAFPKHGDLDARSELVAQAVTYAPEPLQAIFRAKAREMGLFPEATHYTEDGEPIYTTAQLAKHLGISLEEANRAAEDLAAKHPDLADPIDPSKLYRRQ